MNPWKILEVAPTADAREIKRAYAKKLKMTKPDEKPAEFQALHQAYKAALHSANNREAQRQQSPAENAINSAPETAVPDDSVLPEKSRPHTVIEETTQSLEVTQPLEVAQPLEATLSPEISTRAEQQADVDYDNSSTDVPLNHEQQLRREEYNRLITEVQELLENKRLSHDDSPWHFIAHCPYLLEEDFNWYLGREIFRLLAEYGQARVRYARGRYHNRQVPTAIVQYCAQIFSWRNLAYYLEQEFGRKLCGDLFRQMEEEHHVNNPGQGLRGGTLIRSNESARARPTQQESPGTGMSAGTIFFILFVLAKILYLIQSTRN